jgi:hypothetical protein
MIQEKMLVNVTSSFGSGLGWVQHISDFAFSPIQVELFKGGADGHKTIRFYHSEVEPVQFLQPIECLWPEEVELEVKLDEKPVEVEVEPEAPEVEPKKEKPPVNMIVQMTDEIKGYSFKQGDIFAASEVGSKYNSCYYLYDPVSFELRGCMVKEAFQLLYDNLSISEITNKVSLMDFVKRSIEKRVKTERVKKTRKAAVKTVTKIVEPDPPQKEEQMSLFDF